jgi:hypothetical protein
MRHCAGVFCCRPTFKLTISKWPIASIRCTDQAVYDGALTLKYRKNVASQLLYSGYVFDDLQICVNVKLLESVAADKEYASLVFWAKDYSSFLRSMVPPIGSGWRNT